MDNHENNDDALKNQEDANAESPREDIPLWLQGMEEPLDDETKPIDANKDQAGNWIREIENINSEALDEDAPDLPEGSDLDKAEFETEVNVNAFEELSQLEHIEDVSGKGETKADEIAGDQEDSEITEEFVVDSLIDQPPYDDIDSDIEELATNEGFVDISQLGLDQQTGDAVEYIDDESLREGDLPEWLQEMIAESEQETGEEGDIDIKDEILIPDLAEESQDSSMDKEFSEDELFVQEEVASPEDKEAPDITIDEVYTMTDEDTTPIEIVEEPQAAQPQDQLTQDEDFEISEETPVFDTPPLQEIVDAEQEWVAIEQDSLPEAEPLGDKNAVIPVDAAYFEEEAPGMDEAFTEVEEIPLPEEPPTLTDMETIDRIKAFISQGQMDQAQGHIEDVLEDADQIDQLEAVLSEMADQPDTATSEVLETLGDIALKQNKPKDAFDAYAKALKLLLENEGDSDEIS